MLRSEHRIVRYDFRQRQVHPDRLRHGRDDDHLAATKLLLRLYREGIGWTRQSLHEGVAETLSRLKSCPPRRIAAFCKLLDDLSRYRAERKAAVQLRQRVFMQAAAMHPIVERADSIFQHDIESARRIISKATDMPWKQIEATLFGDVVELQTLVAFASSVEPREFLAMYNVAQTQAAMYRAISVTIDVHDDFKVILRHAKLAGLMHSITRLEDGTDGYRFELDGAMSSIRETTRYGVRFARMLPKLLTCRCWQLTADVAGPDWRRFRLQLSPRDGLGSTLNPPEEFDSGLERDVFDHWQKSPAQDWTLQREREVLSHGQTVLTPDFVLRHPQTGRTIYLEVVGYWTPEYLTEKSRRLHEFLTLQSRRSGTRTRWLLMFPKQNASSRELFAGLHIPAIVFDRRRPAQDWIDTALSCSDEPADD
jgi:predicted nuclease of restriction endonuclease-like RecB superfamily